MNNKSQRIFRFQILPIGILLLWLIIIGILVWQRVCESYQPPIYDALGYLLKAKSFWDNVSQGWLQNPLNLVPPIRPPGTVLVSYPFGFTDDYRGFLFRTVFVPFVIWVIALLIAILPVGNKKKDQTFWPALFAVFLLGPIPFFFQFEHPTQAFWGLMDGFLASLAALAIACAGRSIIQKSIFWAVCAAFIATFCILVKPSGSLVLLLTTIFWSGAALIGLIKSNSLKRTKALRFWLIGTTAFIVIGGTTSWMCLQSKYLSQEIVTGAKQAVVILQKEYDPFFTFTFLKSSINSLFGPQFFIVVIVSILIYRIKTSTFRFQVSDWIFLTSSLLFILVGGWFWIIATGVSQLRYFYPFALMFIILFVFIFSRMLYAIEFAKQKFFLWSISIACILPALNLVFLLLLQNPNDQWQKISGVSMHVKSGKAGVEIAKYLQKDIHITNKSPLVYSISQTLEIDAFNCYGMYQYFINLELPHFSTRLPIDWIRPSTFRICEILETDYIIFKPRSNSEQESAFQLKNINSLYEEGFVLEAFLSSLKPENGLVTKYENQECRLSSITDKVRLKEAFDTFIKTKSWRTVFIKENEIATTLALKSISRKVDVNFKESTDKISFHFERIDISESSLNISGWGFLQGLNSDSLESFILFTKNEQIIAYNLIPQVRKDVTAYFATGLDLDSAGFQVKIPIKNFEKGNYQLGLYIVKGNQAGIIFSDKIVSIEN